jgi:hypothetical protein
MRQCSVCLFALVWLFIAGCGPLKLQSEDCPNTPFEDRIVPKGPECSDPRPGPCHRVIVQVPAYFHLSTLTQQWRRYAATICGVPEQTPDSDIVRWLSQNNVLISIVTQSGATEKCANGKCDLDRADSHVTYLGEPHEEVLPSTTVRNPRDRRAREEETYVQYEYHCRRLDVLIHCPAQ